MNRKLKGKIIEQYGSQWKFAEAIHQHESVVSMIVRRRRQLSEKDKQIWADVLGEEIAVLFDFEDSPKWLSKQAERATL